MAPSQSAGNWAISSLYRGESYGQKLSAGTKHLVQGLTCFMEAMEVFSLLSRVHLGPEDLLNSSSLKEFPPDHHETCSAMLGTAGRLVTPPCSSASRPPLSLAPEAGAQKGGDPQAPQKGCSSTASLCYTLESLPVTQLPAEGAENMQSCWRENDSDIPLQADEANKDTSVFCHFFANGLQIWWVNRDDTPLPGEMSWVKLSTSVQYTGRLGGKSPTSTASESVVGIFGLSTNSTHKTRQENLLREESCAWNTGDFTCKMFQGSPLTRDALLYLLSIWLSKMVLHHMGQQHGTPWHRLSTSQLETNKPALAHTHRLARTCELDDRHS